MILHQPILTAPEFCFTHACMAYSLVTATHPSKRDRVWLCLTLFLPWQSITPNITLILTMFVILELLNLLALFPLFDQLALSDPPDLHVGASKICLPSGSPVCVCIHCHWHVWTSFQFQMRNRIRVNVSGYDKRFDITCPCNLIQCISQQGITIHTSPEPFYRDCISQILSMARSFGHQWTRQQLTPFDKKNKYHMIHSWKSLQDQPMLLFFGTIS